MVRLKLIDFQELKTCALFQSQNGTIKMYRNYEFHKKYFACFNLKMVRLKLEIC